MPTPAAPTGFTITPIITNSGAITLDWDHTGTDLDRFLILYKGPGDASFKKRVVAPESDFGAGPYTLDTASGQGFTWKIVALGTGGERSAANPTEDYDATIDGVWLLPLNRSAVLDTDKVAYIRADAPNEDHVREYASFDAPFSTEGFSQSAVMHLPQGSIDGALLSRNGSTAAVWKERLRTLVKGQTRYERVMLASPRDFFPVELTTGPSFSPHPEISYAWNVSVPYRRLKR